MLSSVSSKPEMEISHSGKEMSRFSKLPDKISSQVKSPNGLPPCCGGVVVVVVVVVVVLSFELSKQEHKSIETQRINTSDKAKIFFIVMFLSEIHFLK